MLGPRDQDDLIPDLFRRSGVRVADLVRAASDRGRAMSEENVEIVRIAFDVIYGSTSEATPTGVWTRRHSKRAAEVLDPNIEMHGTIGGLWEGRSARGLSEMFNSFEAEDLEAWDERRLEPQRFLHIDDRVVVLDARVPARQRQRHRSRERYGGCLHGARRAGDIGPAVHGSGRRSRSRRAVGVGDVGGERGDRFAACSTPGIAGTRKSCWR